MASKPLILHVDDDPVIRDLIQDTLAEAGMEVMTAVEVLEGIQFAVARRPDLILLDVHMPEADGYEACIAFRAVPELADIPVLMLTGFTDDQHRQEAMSCGASDYLTKPIESDRLISMIQKWLPKT